MSSLRGIASPTRRATSRAGRPAWRRRIDRGRARGRTARAPCRATSGGRPAGRAARPARRCRTARLGRPDRGHDLGVEHVGVDEDPEPVTSSRATRSRRSTPCRRAPPRRGGPVGRDGRPWEVEDARDGERLVAVRLALVSPPDQRDVLSADERAATGEPRERRVAPADCEGKAHARHRPGHRFLRAREVGVPVDVGEPDGPARNTWPATGMTRAEQAPEHDAAIAAEDDDETGRRRDRPRRGRRTTGCRWPRRPRSGPCRADARSPRTAVAARRRGPSRSAARSRRGPGDASARDSPLAAHRSRRAAGGRCSMALPGLRPGASGKATPQRSGSTSTGLVKPRTPSNGIRIPITISAGPPQLTHAAPGRRRKPERFHARWDLRDRPRSIPPVVRHEAAHLAFARTHSRRSPLAIPDTPSEDFALAFERVDSRFSPQRRRRPG